MFLGQGEGDGIQFYTRDLEMGGNCIIKTEILVAEIGAPLRVNLCQDILSTLLLV